MERRIFGLENEYGVTCTFRGQRRLSPDEVARYLFRRVVSWGRSSNVFLENGARLYLDVGSHPEYATPECDSHLRPRRPRQGGGADPRGAAAARPSSACARRASAATSTCSRTTPTRPATPTAATRTTSWLGTGEFARDRRRADPVLRDAGRSTPAPARCCTAPRGAQYCIASGPSTSGRACRRRPRASRPIINTRDEPHADAERFRRLHVIVGDSNMSE